MKKIQTPHIGARTIKTGLTVLVCSLVSLFILKRDTPFISCISGITCIQNNMETSVSTGKNRVLGTIIGAITGFLGLYIGNAYIGNKIVLAICASLGIVLTICICNFINIQNCIMTASIMFLILLMNIGEEQWLSYSLIRTIDTFIGVFIGIIINRFVLKKSFENVKES